MRHTRIPVILASKSPERKVLLEEAGIPFRIRAAQIHEASILAPSPTETVKKRARAKAEQIAGEHAGGVILAADTMVLCGRKTIGKAHSARQAAAILRELSGRWQTVITGVHMIWIEQDKVMNFSSSTKMLMKKWSPAAIEAYVMSGQWRGKAGAYGYLGRHDPFVAGITGSESNIRGLPVQEVLNVLRDWGITRFLAS